MEDYIQTAKGVLSYSEIWLMIDDYYKTGYTGGINKLNSMGINTLDIQTLYDLLPGSDDIYQVLKNADGSVRSVNINYGKTVPNINNVANSNLPPTKTMIQTPTTVQYEVLPSGKVPKFTAGMKTAGNFVFKEVVPAIGATAAGITLAKVIDKTLYDINPDFWNAHDMGSLDPDTWNSITSGDDSLSSRLFNFVFGLDPDKNAQAYMDERAFAYMAQYLKDNGVFDKDKITASLSPSELDYAKNLFGISDNTTFTYPIPLATDFSFFIPFPGAYSSRKYKVQSSESPVYFSLLWIETDSTIRAKFILSSLKPFTYEVYRIHENGYEERIITSTSDSERRDGHLWYTVITNSGTGDKPTIPYIYPDPVKFNPGPTDSNVTEYSRFISYILVFGTQGTSGSIPGISSQSGGTLPDTTAWDSVQNTLTSLQTQYPELWANKVTQTVAQPDGTLRDYNYIPVGLPTGQSWDDTQPTTGDSTQGNPQYNPETATKELTDFIEQLLQNAPPTNPPDTGGGNSPDIVPPVGSAEALFKIYNPTQDQLNAFGSWLWSSNFVEQLKKVFNNPMQSIIGLHKVFVTPPVAGTSNIKVGYLDSGVASNYIGDQYVTVDCGTVDVFEYFGNVFDYDPFTKISLYLPFIGIVPLNTGEIMRGSVGVVYHVDVLTGACLAEVNVNRDLAGGTLYTYAGNCACQYPLSSGSYMGIVASLAGVVGSVAGAVATGGALAPVAVGSVAGLLGARTNVQHSGGFSGNAGAMGCKIPYIIITRSQSHLADNFQAFDGQPDNTTVKLSSLTGYAQVKSVHVDGIIATDDELELIESTLKEGVII